MLFELETVWSKINEWGFGQEPQFHSVGTRPCLCALHERKEAHADSLLWRSWLQSPLNPFWLSASSVCLSMEYCSVDHTARHIKILQMAPQQRSQRRQLPLRNRPATHGEALWRKTIRVRETIFFVSTHCFITRGAQSQRISVLQAVSYILISC